MVRPDINVNLTEIFFNMIENQNMANDEEMESENDRYDALCTISRDEILASNYGDHVQFRYLKKIGYCRADRADFYKI